MKWVERHFLGVQTTCAVALTAALIAWVQWGNGRCWLDSQLSSNRPTIYAALASVCGSLLGFVIAAASIIAGFATQESLRLLRESDHYQTLWKVFVNSARVLGIATLAALAALILDRDQGANPAVLYLTAFASVWASLRVWTCIVVLAKILAAISGLPPQQQSPIGTAPK